MNKMNDSYKTQLSAACLLLSVAEADKILENAEIDIIQEIIKDYFCLSENNAIKLINQARTRLETSMDLFEFGQHLNTVFDYSDRKDFITCIFEVAFGDGNLHYLERHSINKIANILNVTREDLINSKIEIESFLD